MNIKRIVSFALALLAAWVEAAPLKIGWSTNDISTDQPVQLGGTYYVRVSKGRLDPLTTTALAIDNGEDCVVFLSMDIVSPPSVIVRRVRKRIKAEIPDLPNEKVIINATHTHNGVHVWRGDQKLRDEYCDYAVDQIVKTIKEAWTSRKPGQIAYGYDLVVTAFNRRIVYFTDRKGGIGSAPRGKAALHGRTDTPDFSHVEGGADPFANYLYTYDMEGKLTGAIINIGYTAQCTQPDTWLSSDTWHDIRQLMAEHHPGICILPQVSAAGEATYRLPYYHAAEKRSHRLMFGREPAYIGEFERKVIAGRILTSFDRAHEWAQKEKFSDLPLRHVTRTLRLSAYTPTEQEYQEARKGLETIAKQRTDPPWKDPAVRKKNLSALNSRENVCKRIVRLYENRDKIKKIPMEFHVLRIGDVGFVSEQYEYYFEFGQRIQARSPFIQTFVIELAGMGGGYLATERATENGGYGTGFLCPVSPKGGQEIVEAAVAMLNELKAEDAKDR